MEGAGGKFRRKSMAPGNYIVVGLITLEIRIPRVITNEDMTAVTYSAVYKTACDIFALKRRMDEMIKYVNTLCL